MSTNVAPKSVFLDAFFDFPNSSPPSLIETERTFCGNSAAFELTSSTFKLSLGENNGFSIQSPRLSTGSAP